MTEAKEESGTQGATNTMNSQMLAEMTEGHQPPQRGTGMQSQAGQSNLSDKPVDQGAYLVSHEQHAQVEEITGINNDMISPSKLLLAKQRKTGVFAYEGLKEKEVKQEF